MNNRYLRVPKLASKIFVCALCLLTFVTTGCEPTQFATAHIQETAGEQIIETASYTQYPGLNNIEGSDVVQVPIDFVQPYSHQIKVQLEDSEISEKSVKDKLVELYKLPPNNPEDTVMNALCPVSLMIPAGMKSTVKVEWIERWAEGIIKEGAKGEGSQLGTYEVFIGYFEPCSVIEQRNEQ